MLALRLDSDCAVGLGCGGGLGIEQEGPERDSGGDDDGGGCGVGVDVAGPFAEEVGGLVEARILCELGFGGVVDGVGETLGDDVVGVGVDVGLEGEHVGGSEFIFGLALVGEDPPNALIAVG